ncbi:MAG: extracellular solute-binding protein [Pseudomonadota bacterium]
MRRLISRLVSAFSKSLVVGRISESLIRQLTLGTVLSDYDAKASNPAYAMLRGNTQAIKLGCFLLLLISSSHLLHAEDIQYQHGYAFLSTPAYPADFTHFSFINPDAPKGGRIRVPEMGNWDSFNIISAKGRVARGTEFWSVDENLVWDSLLVPALDEPATSYGLIAEGVAVAEDRSWVAFKLRSEARWHDGKPITVDDVVFSLNAFQNDASPTIQNSLKGFSIEVIGSREFKYHIHPALRSDPSVIRTLGHIPILPKHYWATRDITKTTVEPPLGSGPYRIGKFSVGRWIEYERVKDYWAAELPVYKGRFNFDIVKFDYFRDDQVQTEAVKGHVIDIHVENVPRTWVSKYDFPAYNDGYLKKNMLRLAKPGGLWWPIFWNMEQKRFQDLRVRKALWLLQDMVWGKKRSYDFFDHAVSFFHDSEFAARDLPSSAELELLEPLRDKVPPAVFTEPYRPQPNTGTGWSRENILLATKLLAEAGWSIKDRKLVHGETGEPFHIRFVAVSPALAGSFISYAKLLKRLGITSTIKAPEISNWLYRMRSGDFDAGAVWFLPTNTPTLQVKNLFSSSEAGKAYGSNWPNLKDPAIDALIDAITNADSWENYVTALRAFDRVMLHNYYWLPMSSKTRHAIAYWNKFGIPEHDRLLRLAFIDTWWMDPQLAASVEDYTGGDN